jgi:hypothetical protein
MEEGTPYFGKLEATRDTIARSGRTKPLSEHF